MKEEKVFFKNSKGLTLAGRLVTPDNYKATIILSIGIGGRTERELEWEDKFAKEGYRCLFFDYSGRYESEGKWEDTTLTTNIDDLKSALNFLNCEVAVVAFSFGAQTAIQVASEDKRIINLVTLYSAHNILEWRRGEIYKIAKEKGYFQYASGNKYYLKLFEDAKKYDTLKEINKIKVPWLIIHGDSDESIPAKQSEDIYERANQPKQLKIFKGEGH